MPTITQLVIVYVKEDDHSKPEVRTIDPTQDCIFPPQLKVRSHNGHNE